MTKKINVHHFSILSLIFLMTLILNISKSAQANELSNGKVIAAFAMKETIEKDQCFPIRKNLKMTFTWYLIELDDRKILLNKDTSLMNPMEHSILTYKNHSSNKSNGIVKDKLEITYGEYGVLISDFSATLYIKDDVLSGSFNQNVDFKTGTLGYQALELWTQSHKSLQKVPVKVDSIPPITKKPPCQVQGKLIGTRIDNPKIDFIPSKEIEYLSKMRRSEELFSLSRLDESIAILKQISTLMPKRVGPLWRLSRAYFIQAEHLDPEDRDGRLKTLAISEKYARQALGLDSESGESWFFLTAALGRFATTKGILRTIKVTGELERGFLNTIKYKPSYNFAGFATAGDAQCGLGIYYRLVPDWWIVKVITGSRGNIDKAIKHLKESLRYQPYRVEYNKELGVSLICRGVRQERKKDIDEGIAVLKRTLNLPTLLDTDIIDKRHIPEIIEQYPKACGYSRDGYEDTSKKSFSELNAEDQSTQKIQQTSRNP